MIKLEIGHLTKLADRAAGAQVLEHNEEDAPSSGPMMRAFELAASRVPGVASIQWPGLYPVLVDSEGFWHHMPEDPDPIQPT